MHPCPNSRSLTPRTWRYGMRCGRPQRPHGGTARVTRLGDCAVTEAVNPRGHSNPSRQAAYWVYYGRALARLPRRHDDAARALRTAERMLPHRVQRDPFAREVLGELVARSNRDAVGRELRGMGLPGRVACIAQLGDLAT